MFLNLPDPDPLVISPDPSPDPAPDPSLFSCVEWTDIMLAK
jgi:hypothetical protein